MSNDSDYPNPNDVELVIAEAFARIEKKILTEAILSDDDINDIMLYDMYGDTAEADAANLLKQRQAAAANARSHIKMRGKDAIEITDENKNKIVAVSEVRVNDLEALVNRQQEIIKIQAGQINFLNNKFVTMQNELKQLQDAMQFVYERF